MDERLGRQIGFLQEVDRLKGVLRRSYVLAGERRENAAEHCWHVALAAVVLAEHAAEPVDVGRVVTMLLVHDLVEIDAGDTFVYDRAAQNDKRERERAAADRVFGLLPDDLGSGLRALWEEFEARLSPRPASPPPSTASCPCTITSGATENPGRSMAFASDRCSRSTATWPRAPQRCGHTPRRQSSKLPAMAYWPRSEPENQPWLGCARAEMPVMVRARSGEHPERAATAPRQRGAAAGSCGPLPARDRLAAVGPDRGPARS